MILNNYFKVFLVFSLLVSSVCYAQEELSSDAFINQQQEEVIDPLIQDLLSVVDENEDQLEIINFPDKQSNNIEAEQNGFNATLKYRELQEQHKLWFVLLISIMTPIFLYVVLSFLKKSDDNSGINIVNVTGLILVIQATVLIVVTSTTSEQLTAAIGVIAAIAGYLFGSSTQKN